MVDIKVVVVLQMLVHCKSKMINDVQKAAP